MADRLLPTELRPWLQTQRFGAVIHHFDRLGSTQQAALEAAREGAAEGTLFVAESQTSGRGRHGHAWDSPPGEGIYASLVLRPQRSPQEILLLTLASGLGVADAVIEVSGLQPEIRWPNDLLLEGRKFCGLLMETSIEADRVQYAVLGIGINVHQCSFPPELAGLATSIELHAPRAVSRLRLCAAVVRHVEARYLGFGPQGHRALIEEFERRSVYARGMKVAVGGGGPDGYRGETEGLDASGFLRVRLPDGSRRMVVSGEVRPAPVTMERPPAPST